MKVAFDCAYDDKNCCAVTAVLFRNWEDGEPLSTISRIVENVPAYQSGAFYKRELIPLMIAYNEVVTSCGSPEVLIIDGFVDLGEGKPGLGRKLYQATGLPVIGVAKNDFIGAPFSPILRGNSKKALFISAAEFSLIDAAKLIQNMHGPFRIPTLLRLADFECRQVLRVHA